MDGQFVPLDYPIPEEIAARWTGRQGLPRGNCPMIQSRNWSPILEGGTFRQHPGSIRSIRVEKNQNEPMIQK